MKSKYVILASALLISVATFAQKDQLKAAEKAMKAGDAKTAITILEGAESVMANASDAEKAQFLYAKGNAYLDLANKKVDEAKNLSLAAKSYQDLIAAEKTSGKLKFSSLASTSITQIKGMLVNSAIVDTKTNKDLDGANKLYDAYLLDKKDTINLYYAASTYVSAKEYVTALKMYEELKTLNYSGKGMNYLAMNKVSGQEDLFNTAKERDAALKLTHEKPKDEVIPSKRGEIYKNIALILQDQGKVDEAKKALSDARKANPEDTSLTLSEANLYLQTKDFETYKKLIAEVLEKNPNDADLIFNLGVISANAKNAVDAEKYYKKAIEIKPDYINAYINMAALKLEDEKVIIEEMNKLGTTSAKDIKRYDVLKVKRENLFKSTIPYLQKAHELEPTNRDVAKTLLNVYSALEMPEYKAMKIKVKELDAAAAAKK
ncbi:tetratricopeptide repeat protein [Flavobacterium eburneipallidum]|uniref:tetratricopeptide repeat protein n=1 Tax=Flavobacterium eburneipallidum TaxID=3003263 RepID=UPI0022AC8D29|nr:tetratricopeptide repeat protein [Flavobacterium eburneipallidum]